MKLESVADQVALTTSTPEEAASNLNDSRALGVPVGIYKDSKATFQPDLKRFSSPLASPIVARNIARSEEHAALVAPDAKPLGVIEGAWKALKESFAGIADNERAGLTDAARVIQATPQETINAIKIKTGPQARLNDLGYRKLRNKGVLSDQFTEDDEFELISLRQDESDNFGMTPSGLTGFWETAIPQVGAQIADLPALLERNKGTIASITAATTATNAGVGALIGGPAGALVGAKIGLAEGAVLGWRAASALDAYRATAGSTYNYLDRAVDANKAPLNIDDKTKEYISHGVGAASGLVATVADKLLIKRVPWLNRMMSGEGIRDIVTNPANAQLKAALVNIGKSMASEGAEESAQEVIQIIGEEIGQTYSQSEASFVNGIIRAGQKIASNEGGKGTRVLQAGGIGSIAGAGTTVALNTAGTVASKVLTPKTKSDISPKYDTNADAVRVLEAQDVMDGTALIAGSTKLSQLAPVEQNEIISQIVADSGVKNVYVDRDDLETLAAGNEDKSQIIRTLLGQEPNINAPVTIPIQQFMEIRTEFPTITEYMKMEANGHNPMTAKELVKQYEAANQRRETITNKLGAYEKPPTERAYAIDINDDLDDDTKLGQTLQTKEVAQEFLTRLDVEDMTDDEANNVINARYSEISNAVSLAEQELQTATEANDVERIASLTGAITQLTDERTQLLEQQNAGTGKRGKRQSLRERTTTMLDTIPDEKSAKEILQQALDTPQPVNDVAGEADYMMQPTFTEALRGVLPEKEVEAIDNAVVEARSEIADQLNDAARAELEQNVDVYLEIAEESIRQEEEAKVLADPNIDVVERFINGPIKINPDTLTDAQKEKYLKNPLLKKHKVFSKDLKTTAQEAAAIYGFRTGDMLLDLLGRTDNREDTIQARIELRAQEADNMARASVEIDQPALDAAFNKKADSYVQIARTLKNADWSAFKKAIKRIALKTPVVAELRHNARKAISTMKIGDLNVNKFRAGERKSHRKAVTAILAGDVETGFVNLEATILNSELQLATMNANRKLKNGIRFVKKFLTADMQREISEAGPLAVKAMNEILDNFNLVPSKKGDSIASSWKNFVQEMVQQGRGDVAISDELTDVRETFNDMTVAQALAAVDALRAIQKYAKDINESKLAQAQETHEQLVARFSKHLQTQHQYNIEKGIVREGAPTFGQYTKQGFLDLLQVVNAVPHIAVQLDNENTGGLARDLIVAPLKGDGRFTGQGADGEAQDMIKLEKHMSGIIAAFNEAGEKEYGATEWQQMQNTDINVPEFEGSKRLKGKVTRLQLWMMQMYMGEEGSRRALAEGEGIDIDTIAMVLDRELDERYAALTQNVWDALGSYKDRVFALEKRVNGVEPEMVQSKPYEHRGKVYPGGWMHISYDNKITAEKLAERDRDRMKAAAEGKPLAPDDSFGSADMTEHGHTKNRVGGTGPVSLDVNQIARTFRAIIHDLNYREPLAQVLKVITDPTISTDMSRILGPTGYNVLLSGIRANGYNPNGDNNAVLNTKQAAAQAVGNILGRASASSLLFSPMSMFKQAFSLPFAFNRMGYIAAAKHVGLVAHSLNYNPFRLAAFNKFADEIVPSLKNSRQNYDDNAKDSVTELLPERSVGGKRTAAFWEMKKKVDRAGWAAFGGIDNAMKSLVAVSSYNQFMAGDVEGWTMEKVMALSEDERDHQAKMYANGVVETTLTAGSTIDRSYLQREYRSFAQYFNDARNTLNGTFAYTGRKINRDMKNGDYDKAAMTLVATWLTLGAVNVVSNAAKRWSGYGTEDEDDTWETWLKNRAIEVAIAPADIVTDLLPISREIKFAVQSNILSGKTAAVPGNTVVTAGVDFTNVIMYAYNFMNDTSTEIDKKTAKSMGRVVSYFTPGGLPVKPFLLLEEAINTPDELFAKPIALADMFRARFKTFQKEQAQLPPAERVDEDILNELQEIDTQLAPPEEKKRDSASFIPDATYDVIKMIESGGDALAQNPKSSAAGLYQFTKPTWDDVKRRSGLPLTDNGRVSKNTTQQEEAMKWFTEDNTRKLVEAEIEPTIPNIYAAHFLGARKAVQVLTADGSTKLADIVSDDVMEANDFEPEMKVKEFRRWARNKVNSAVDALSTDDQEALLTLVDNEP